MDGFAVFLCFFFLLVVVMAALVIHAVNASKRQVNEAWRAAALTLRLPYQDPALGAPRRMEGALPTGHVVVETFTPSGGKSSTTSTRYRARYPQPLGLGLRLTRESFISGVGKLVGIGDIEVGDTAFDSQVLVKGNDPRRVVEFLTPARRSRILRALHAFPGVVIGDAEIVWESVGLHADSSRIVATTRQLSELAQFLGSKGAPAGSAPPRAAAASGAAAVPSASAAAARPPRARREVRRLRAERTSVSGAGSLVRAAAPAATPEPQRPQAPPTGGSRAPPAFAAPALSDASSVCEDLFRPERTGLEVEKAFEERYAGARIRWKGLLETVDPYSYDFVFGNVAGTKAVFRIHQVPSGPYGTEPVRATVQLPAGSTEALRKRVGSTLGFEGRLAKVDSFLRNLYVADGQVETPEA